MYLHTLVIQLCHYGDSLAPGSPAQKIKGGRGRERLVHFDHVRDVVCTFTVDFAHTRARAFLALCESDINNATWCIKSSEI